MRSKWLNGTLVPVDRLEGLVNLKRTWLPVQAETVPVEESKRGIAGLLDLGEHNSPTGRMNGACGKRDAVTRLWDKRMQTFHYRSRSQMRHKFGARDPGFKPAKTRAVGSA